MNQAKYRKPVTDAWFSAQQCAPINRFDRLNTTACSTPMGLSFLGCQERYQYCTSKGTHCSPLAGSDDSRSNEWPQGSLNLSPSQQAVLNLVRTTMRWTRLNYQVDLIGVENLVASEYLWTEGAGAFFSAPLPSDHWEAEVRRWMDTTLAVLQRAGSFWARPPEFDVGPGISSQKYIVPPQGEENLLLCHKIKVRSGSHASFSVLGLGLTVGFGCFLIVLRWILPSLVSMIQVRTGRGLYRRLEWIESSVFQLHRVAAEGKGIGPWEGKEEDIPRVVGEKKFNLTMGHLQEKTLDDPSSQSDSKGTEVPRMTDGGVAA